MISKYSFLTAASALVVGAALVLTGCSSNSSTGASSSSKSSSPAQGQRQGGAGGQGGFGGGTTGEIAAVSGSTLQVQSSSSQTAVDVGSSTTITKTVDVALSAVKVGECVTASTRPAQGSSSSSSSSDSSGSSGSAVTTVAISQPTNGSCDAGFGGQGGRRPSGQPTNRPSGRPSGFPSGAPSAGRGGSFVLPTSGKVTAVSGSTITVDALDFQTQKTSSKTVTVDSSTTYTEQQSGTSSDLVVGQCVVARGKADDTGAVAATAITVSAPVNGSCETGFGGRGGFGGGRGGTSGNDNSNSSGGTNG